MHRRRLFYFFRVLNAGLRCNNALDKIVRPAYPREQESSPCEQRAIFHAHVRGCEPYVTHILRGGKKEDAYVYVRVHV